MRLDLVRFIESIVDESVISFMIQYLNSQGVHQLMSHLEYANEETRERWHRIYSQEFDNAMKMKKRGQR